MGLIHSCFTRNISQLEAYALFKSNTYRARHGGARGGVERVRHNTQVRNRRLDVRLCDRSRSGDEGVRALRGRDGREECQPRPVESLVALGEGVAGEAVCKVSS